MCNGKCNRISEVVYKCEEIRVSCFSKSSDVFDPIVLNGKQIEKILSWKVLGRSQMERKRESRSLRKCYFALAFEFPPAVGKHLVPSTHLALFCMFGLWLRLRSFSLIITAVIACVTEAFPIFVLFPTFWTNWPGKICYAIYRGTCQTHYYSWLISPIRKLYLQQISPSGKSRVGLIAEDLWARICLIKLLTVTHTMPWILKITWLRWIICNNVIRRLVASL